MISNNLVYNLQQLTTKQWRLFLEFVDSPYFNKHQKVVVLAKYLHTCAPSWLEKDLNRRIVFKKCFPNQIYELQKIKNIFSKLQKQLREFIAINHFQKNKEWKQSALIQASFDLNMPQLWNEQNKKYKQEYIGSYHAYDLLEIEKSLILKQGDRKSTQVIVDNQINWLEDFFWRERFRLAIEHISLANVLNLEVKNQNWDLLNHLPATLLDNKTISRYRLAFQMLRLDYPQSKVAFLGLLDSIKENDFSGCSPKESHAFYVYAVNYCTARANSGVAGYYKYLFEIYELMDIHGRLIQNGTLSQGTFLNIVGTASNLGKFDWATTFIQKYKIYLPLDKQKNAIVYNLSLLCFYKKEYDEALRQLHKVTFTDPHYALTARVLEIRIFYAQEEWLVLDALFERLRIYLLRDKQLPKQRKQESQHFLRLTKILTKLAQQNNYKKKQAIQIQQLLEKIDNSKWLMHRSWLKMKTNKLFLE